MRPQADLVEEERVDLPGHVHHPAEGGAAAELALELRHQGERVLGDLEHLGHEPADLVVAIGRADADHDADDRLRRDPPHRRLQGERGAVRPGGHVARRDLLDQSGVAADRRSVECGREQAAMMAVLLAVEQEQRALAQHGAEERVRRAHPEAVRVAAEHLPGGLGLGDERAPLERSERTVKIGPWRSRLRSMNLTGSLNHCRICQRPGVRGPGRQIHLELLRGWAAAATSGSGSAAGTTSGSATARGRS